MSLPCTCCECWCGCHSAAKCRSSSPAMCRKAKASILDGLVQPGLSPDCPNAKGWCLPLVSQISRPKRPRLMSCPHSPTAISPVTQTLVGLVSWSSFTESNSPPLFLAYRSSNECHRSYKTSFCWDDRPTLLSLFMKYQKRDLARTTLRAKILVGNTKSHLSLCLSGEKIDNCKKTPQRSTPGESRQRFASFGRS